MVKTSRIKSQKQFFQLIPSFLGFAFVFYVVVLVATGIQLKSQQNSLKDSEQEYSVFKSLREDVLDIYKDIELLVANYTNDEETRILNSIDVYRNELPNTNSKEYKALYDLLETYEIFISEYHQYYYLSNDISETNQCFNKIDLSATNQRIINNSKNCLKSLEQINNKYEDILIAKSLISTSEYLKYLKNYWDSVSQLHTYLTRNDTKSATSIESKIDSYYKTLLRNQLKYRGEMYENFLGKITDRLEYEYSVVTSY